MHIGSLSTDGASSVHSEVRFHNSSEQTVITHHFHPLCSSACTDDPSGIFEDSFETRNVTCKFYQGTGSCFQVL